MIKLGVFSLLLIVSSLTLASNNPASQLIKQKSNFELYATDSLDTGKLLMEGKSHMLSPPLVYQSAWRLESVEFSGI